MDQQIFKDWFEIKFKPQAREHLRTKNLPEKAVLLLDNASFHPGRSVLRSADGNCLWIFWQLISRLLFNFWIKVSLLQ